MFTRFDSSTGGAYSHGIELEKKKKVEVTPDWTQKKKKKEGEALVWWQKETRGDHSCVEQSIYLLYSTCIRISSDSYSLFSVSFTLDSLT